MAARAAPFWTVKWNPTACALTSDGVATAAPMVSVPEANGVKAYHVSDASGNDWVVTDGPKLVLSLM